jgi:uncharacterized protein (TIGR02266 family)
MPPPDDRVVRRQRRVDVRIKINLRYPDRETFVSRFSHNLSRTGIFIRASDPAPVGSRIRFEYRLQDDSRILRGAGIVRWARPPEAASENEPAGMGLEFIDLDEESDQLVQQIVGRFGEGSRAPQRRKKQPAPVTTPAVAASAPALSLEAASLDREEEDALDALLGGGPSRTAAAESQAADLLVAPTAAPDDLGEVELPGVDLHMQAEKQPDEPSDDEPVLPEVGPEVAPVVELDALGISEMAHAEVDDESAAAGISWILDLAGSHLVAAPVADPSSAVVSSLELAGVEGRLEPSAGGRPLANLIHWAARPSPSAYAAAVARRHGIQLTGSAEQMVMTMDGATIPVRDAVDALLDQATAPFATAFPREVFVVIPASASSAVCEMLRDRLGSLGATTVHLIPDALALLRGLSVTLDPGHWGLVVQVGVEETRVVLVRGADEIIACHAAPDLGLHETDKHLVERCTAALLRGHGVDVEGDPAMRADLNRQVAAARKAAATSWHLTAGQAALGVDAATLGRWTAVWRERIAITCEALLSTHGGEQATPSAVVLAADEPAWPGLAATLTELLGAEILVAAPGFTGRCLGVR